MCIVCQSLKLTRETACRIMDKGFFGTFRSQSFVQNTGHLMQVNQRHLFFSGQIAHGLGIVLVSILYSVVFSKASALGGCNQHRYGLFCPGLIDKLGQAFPIRQISPLAFSLLFLVVMSKFHQYIIAGLDLSHNLFQPAGCNKTIG